MFTFSPSDNALTMTNSPGLSITNQITICIWTARRAVAAGLDGQGGILSKGHNSASPPEEQFFFGGAHGGSVSNTLEFHFYRRNSSLLSQWRTANDVYIAGGETRTDFLALTYDYSDSTSTRVYVNGVISSGTWVANDPGSTGPTNNNVYNFEVGYGRSSSNPCGGGNRWLGYYSELAIWDTILTFSQLELIRKSKVKGIHKQINPSSLKLYLPLDSAPNGVSLIALGSAGTQEFPDRQNFGPRAQVCANGIQPIGRGERVCSYQPNE